MSMRALIFALLVISAFCFADAAPSPPPPAIKVIFTDGGNAYDGTIEAYYHCVSEAPEDESPVGERAVQLDCEAGVCRNTDWFYKLNPCYDAERGYIEYSASGGGMISTGPMDLESNGRRITIDVASGEVVQEDLGILEAFCCLPMALIPLLLMSGIFKNR